jgi:hypothetical protein
MKYEDIRSQLKTGGILLFSGKGEDSEGIKFFLRALSNCRHEVSGRPYERDEIELLKSACDGKFGENKEDLSSLFCSELVAEA